MQEEIDKVVELEQEHSKNMKKIEDQIKILYENIEKLNNSYNQTNIKIFSDTLNRPVANKSYYLLFHVV